MQRWHPFPAAVYRLVESSPGSVLLESGPSGSETAESRLFLSPSAILTAWDLSTLERLFEQLDSAVRVGLFAAGYFAYECGTCFEPSATQRPGLPGLPLAWFGIYPQCHILDHGTGAFVDGEPAEFAGLESEQQPLSSPAPDIELGLRDTDYAGRVEAIHEFIRAGDVYQLNFTFPLRFEMQGSIADLYATLRSRQPVDYGAFLHCDSGRRILSFSPELFFRLNGGEGSRRIVTRPMKGTAPRGRTTAEDRTVGEWLRSDPKNRSENVMIVDLLRNDLGRLCEYGSVSVDQLFGVERHPTLWQMTSTVSGELRETVSYRDVFRALFPSGSVTGAPKLRAMQLIAQIESEPRGVYTGAIGYFSPKQTVFNVAIRTIELNGHVARMGVGSGIVIDSVAAEEFRECALKAQFLRGPSQPFLLIETMRWEGRYPLLELHLDRLEDSADYFGYACSRASARASLLRLAETFGDASPRRVRLTLSSDGSIQLENSAIADASLPSALRVCVAENRTDASDRFLFHKTTNRALYVETLAAARRAGFDDAIFLNREGQVTEGAVHNIFIEREGRWCTPAIECGLLAGVCRRHLLETRPEIEERILHLDDLKAGDSVYLSNAVSGLRRVVIDWEHAADCAARDT